MMVAIITRRQWGAQFTIPSGRHVPLSSRRWFVVHWPGSAAGGDLLALWRSIERFHRVNQGWQAAPGYNFGVTRDGRVLEGCGLLVRGIHEPARNTDGFGVCVLIGTNETPPAAALNACRALYDWLNRQTGRTLNRGFHGQFSATSCAGPALNDWVRRGMPATGGGQPAPGGAPPFDGVILRQPPIMRRESVRVWQTRVRARGWGLAVDGAYGPISEAACRDVQRIARLTVDGRVGPNTWPATWRDSAGPGGTVAPARPRPSLNGMEPVMLVQFSSNGRAVIGLPNNITHIRLASTDGQVRTTWPGSGVAARTDTLNETRADIARPARQTGLVLLERLSGDGPVYLSWIEPVR